LIKGCRSKTPTLAIAHLVFPTLQPPLAGFTLASTHETTPQTQYVKQIQNWAAQQQTGVAY
jgi:hypothetical protein